MTQTERRLFLIQELLKEQPQYSKIEIPSGEQEQKYLLRSLFNIRMPSPPADDSFLEIQDVCPSRKNGQTKQKVTDLRLLLRTLCEMTDITELTPTLVNSLIERIEVHNNDKSSGHCYVKVDIYFTAAVMIDIPTEQEILAMYDGRNTGKSARLPLCNITRRYGVTHFTELHRILHKKLPYLALPTWHSVLSYQVEFLRLDQFNQHLFGLYGIGTPAGIFHDMAQQRFEGFLLTAPVISNRIGVLFDCLRAQGFQGIGVDAGQIFLTDKF